MGSEGKSARPLKESDLLLVRELWRLQRNHSIAFADYQASCRGCDAVAERMDRKAMEETRTSLDSFCRDHPDFKVMPTEILDEIDRLRALVKAHGGDPDATPSESRDG